MRATAATTTMAAVLAFLATAAWAQEPILQLDFGKADSEVEVGFTQVTAATLYSPEQGYGWRDNAVLKEADQESGNALQRDFIYGYAGSGDQRADFLIDLEPGHYWLALMAGDMRYNRGGLPMDVLVNDEVAIAEWSNFKWEYRLMEVEAGEEPVAIGFRSSHVPVRRYSWWHCNGIVVLAADTREDAEAQMDAMFATIRDAWYADYEEVFPEEDPVRGQR